MSEQENYQFPRKTFGAETFGVQEFLTVFKWDVKVCIDWEIDQQYIADNLDNPEVLQEYLGDIESKGQLCIHCLWNDGDMCCHPIMEAAKEVVAR